VVAAARGNGEDDAGCEPQATRELYWGLMKLLERLAGGERERAHELEAAAAMATVRLGVARGGGTTSFYRWLGGCVGDGR
jgi:hypothetical protein